MKVSQFNFRQYASTKVALLHGAKDDLAELTKKLVKLEDLEANAMCPDYEELEPTWESTTELTRQIDYLLSTIEPALAAFNAETEKLKGTETAPLELPDMNKAPSLL